MIGKLDEYLVHQTEKPLAEVASDHFNWQDRFYFNIHDRQGKFIAATGLGAFPNRHTMDAFLFVVVDGHHYSYYNARPLAADRHDLTVGTLSFSIVEPLVAWQLRLVDEQNRIQGDLQFRARCPLYHFHPIRWQEGDNLIVHQQHYTQSGRYSGTFSVGDRQFSDLIGMRDRSWGVRAFPPTNTWFWVSAQFQNFCITAWLWETRQGQTISADGALVPQDGAPTVITAIEHDLELWPGTKRPHQAAFTFTTAAGDRLYLKAKEISTIFYGRNPNHWSDTDAAALANADATAIGFHQFSEFALGEERGQGTVEYMFAAGCDKYGIAPMTLTG